MKRLTKAERLRRDKAHLDQIKSRYNKLTHNQKPITLYGPVTNQPPTTNPRTDSGV